MESIIISPKNRNESKLITDMLERMKIESKTLTDEEKEYIGLAMMMTEVDRNDKVSFEEVKKKLTS
jgi:hypothetical protein